MFNPFKKRYSTEEMSLFRFMSQIRQFENLNYDELSQIAPCMYLRTFNHDEVVFFRGDPSYALYIVKNGKVSLRVDVNDKFEELTNVRPGEAFGDNSLLNNTKRIYTSVVVSEKADLYVIPQANLLDILDDHPQIRAKIMTSFSELYNEYTSTLFKKYRSAFGFFDLGMVYDKSH
ncbi:cyclic nucleotide-binding domain-containing protein [Reichenbachiella sp. MALMAid0571]|uniref:cyclic nucleotide-binding domain-containing protein n=1 Tax=Reichenbachiella sp. MALMAid0571 TaxID=3143939 RepID=UPI0032DF3E93